MDELIDELAAKVGLDRGTAEKVVQFLRDNARRLPELLGTEATPGTPDELGGMLSGKG